MTRLADRTTRISGSPTMKVTATVDRLRREGVEVIDFGAGEPDFPTPDAVKAAGHAALDQNFTRYTPSNGIVELKRAICDRVTPRTRGIIINSPCNPTGALISESDVAEIADVAARQNIWIVVDLC